MFREENIQAKTPQTKAFAELHELAANAKKRDRVNGDTLDEKISESVGAGLSKKIDPLEELWDKKFPHCTIQRRLFNSN